MVWLARGVPRPRVVKNKLTTKKTLLLIAFTGNGNISIEGAPCGEIVDSERYVNFVKHLGNKFRTLRSSPVRLSDLLWHHDNARPHTSTLTKDFFAHRDVYLVKQSPYSTDLNQCDRWLIKELKNNLRGSVFSNSEEVVFAALQAFKSINKDRFNQEIDRFKNHCHAVIMCGGDYVNNKC